MHHKALIAIQARLKGSLIDEKCRKLVGGIPMLERVIIAAKKSASHINNHPKNTIRAEVCLLVPRGDPLAEEYKRLVPVIEGPDSDVLTRFHMALTTFDPDYIVRIKSHCPLIPPFVITKHIEKAAQNGLDYVYNCDPETRMHPLGWDTEVMSNRLMKWLNAHAVKKVDREGVTSLIRSDAPSWITVRQVLGYTDDSQLKLSVDTEEDLFFVNKYFDIMNRKINTATGSGGIFRL